MNIYAYPPMLIYSILMAFIIGACMGSFLNCAAYRIVRGESFLKGRSRCTSCGHELGLRDLVPLLSWLFSKGRCRYCGAKVSARYPLTELAFGIITVVCLLRFNFTWLCLRNYIFLCVLFVLTLTDIDDMTIPDGCHAIAAAVWLVFEFILKNGWTHTLTHIAAALVFGGGLLGVSLLLDRIMGRDTLGGGDIKLIAVVGLYLGFIGTLFALMTACLTGLIYDAAVIRRRSGGGRAFAFGPWIAAGAAFMLLFGQPLIDWYLNLLA